MAAELSNLKCSNASSTATQQRPSKLNSIRPIEPLTVSVTVELATQFLVLTLPITSFSNQEQAYNGEEQDTGSDVIGVIKIKDGIFICDEFGA